MSNFPSTRQLSLSSTFYAPCGTGVVVGQVAAAAAPQREDLPWFCHDGSRNDAMGGPADSILNGAPSPRIPWLEPGLCSVSAKRRIIPGRTAGFPCGPRTKGRPAP